VDDAARGIAGLRRSDNARIRRAGATAGWRSLAAGVALAFVGTSAFAASCKPKRPKPAIVLKTMGPCAFDQHTASFAGDPVEQAKCLLRGFDKSRNPAPVLESLPAVLAQHVGRSHGLPAREALSTMLSRDGLEWDLAYYLWQPVARARDNDSEAPAARYFVIHDTSGPNYGRRPWPKDIDHNPKINDLRLFRCSDGWGHAHAIINRGGSLLVNHDFSVPWRATKFERARNFDGALKGLFLHVELIQPRRRAPGKGRRNDALAPTPGFTAAQYDRLALLYIIASVRAGAWLIPAFHAPIDAHIRGGHDDPQNFELDAFAGSLGRLLVALEPRDKPVLEAHR
jgi:hypothetical protein